MKRAHTHTHTHTRVLALALARALARPLALALALAFAACPAAPLAPEPTPEPPAEVEPPLVFGGGAIRPKLEKATLDNGLDVYLLPDPGAPLVCVQVWAKVGSVDEHEGPNGPGSGITGLSHFFEHLMFQGTERFPNYDLALAPLGAKNNAFTYQDATVFWAYTPKEHLRHILDIEADRFEHMKVDFVHLEPEREVVKSERRQNIDADPGELAEERAIKRMFDRFPYRWGPIGWMADLDSITLDVAQRYHAEHYTTTGAYLVIAGDFEPAQALAWVKETWGTLQRPATAPDLLRKNETLPLAESWYGPRHDHIVRQVSQPTIYWAFRAPAPGGATLREYAALELIDHALTAGKAGRLSKKLVLTESPKVSSLWARLTPLRYPYAYVWRADLLPGVTTAEVEQVLNDELTAVREHGLSPEELAQAVASLRADAVHTNLSNSDKAETIGMGIASTGNPFALYERLEAYPTISQAEIEATAAKYLVPQGSVRVVVVSPERVAELALALRDSDPRFRGLAPLLEGAAALFIEALDLRDRRAEVDREARAIALLKQRADVATKEAKSKEDKRAIKSYLDTSEMGSAKRTKRLKDQDRALQAAETALIEKQKKLLVTLASLVKASDTSLGGRHAHAIALLATPLDEQIEAPAVYVGGPWDPARGPALGQWQPVAPGLQGSEQLALATLASFALQARGLAATAQESRRWVTAHAHAHLKSELDPEAQALVTLAIELAADSDVSNVPLADTPTSVVRPTFKKGVAP